MLTVSGKNCENLKKNEKLKFWTFYFIFYVFKNLKTYFCQPCVVHEIDEVIDRIVHLFGRQWCQITSMQRQCL